MLARVALLPLTAQLSKLPLIAPAAAAAATQRPGMATGTQAHGGETIDRVVIQEHDKVRTLFKEYQGVNHSQAHKQHLAWEIIRELSMHSIKEEETLYPVIKRLYGDAEYQHFLAEHMTLKQVLSDLDSMNIEDSPTLFDQQVMECEKIFLTHIKEEEEVELPKIVKAPGVDPIKLAQEFKAAGKHAPTRPHTWAPDKAPFNKVTNAMTAPLDAARDAWRFGWGAGAHAPAGPEGHTHTQQSGPHHHSSPPS